MPDAEWCGPPVCIRCGLTHIRWLGKPLIPSEVIHKIALAVCPQGQQHGPIGNLHREGVHSTAPSSMRMWSGYQQTASTTGCKNVILHWCTADCTKWHYYISILYHTTTLRTLSNACFWLPHSVLIACQSCAECVICSQHCCSHSLGQIHLLIPTKLW